MIEHEPIYRYDGKNRLTALGVAKGATGPIASYGYALDAAGHRLSVSESSGRKVNYGYDTIYRLTNETIASDPNAMNGAVSYTYDSVGNRLQKTSTLPGFPGASSTYNANDELTTDAYDADGNTVGSGLNTGTSGYVYDFENRLVQQAGISIVYDGDGNRVSKTTANGTTQYLVDDLNPTGYAQVMDEVQSSVASRTYAWGLELISEHQSISSTPTTSYYVFDGHGSVRALTNSAGAVTDTYDYDAFGILTHSTGTTPNNYLFAGEQFDPDLNLYYNRARYLNTSTGRFWSMDSYDGNGYEPASLHKYLYAQADSVDNFDRDGHLSATEETLAAGEEQAIGAEEDATVLRLYQTTFRTTLYAGKELVYSQPTLLLRAIAALTAVVVSIASVYEAFNSSPGELPDAAASRQYRNDLTPTVLFRDVDGTGKGEFKWRGPINDPDGLSFFEAAFMNPKRKDFSVGFHAKYRGPRQDGALGGFAEPELFNIPAIYTPKVGGELHWSVPVTEENAASFAERFSSAAKRIKAEDPTRFLSNPN